MRLLLLGQRRDAGVVEDAPRELADLVGDHLLEHVLELLGIHLVHALVLAGDDDVDAVGALDVLVEPVELGLQLLDREADGTEHAHGTGVAHRGHDVAAVGEGEDRELDVETLREGGLHDSSLAENWNVF